MSDDDDDKYTADDDEGFLDEFEDDEPTAEAEEEAAFDFEDEDDEDSFALDDEGFELEDEEDAFSDEGTATTAGANNKAKSVAVFLIVIACLFGLWQTFGLLFSDKPETTVAQADDVPSDTNASADDTDGTEATAATDDSDLNNLFASQMDENPAEDASEEPAVAQAEPLDSPALADVAEAAPEVIAPPTQIVQTIDLSPLEAQLSSYNDTMNARLRRIESSLRNVTDDLDDVNRHLGNVGDQVDGVNGLVKNMSEQFHSLGDSAETDRSMQANNESFVNPSLYVHAIIPGRAWLKKRDGGILTITEGDLVGEYGKVLAIDAPSGSVVTSSGTTLR